MKRKFQMKTLKRNNKIVTLLVALVILILGIMIAYVCSKKSAMAADIIQCSSCGGTMSLFRSAAEHGYTCSDCGYSFSDPHTFGYWTSTGTNQHSKTCSACGYTKTGTHTYDVTAGNGTCTDCGYEHTEHTGETHENGGVCTTCGKQYVTHTADKTSYSTIFANDMQHKCCYDCTAENCDQKFETDWEDHTYNKDVGDGACTVCGRLHTAHTGESHDNGGICTTCGKQYVTHTANISDVVGYSIDDTIHHSLIYACSVQGCNGTFWSEKQEHRYSNGTCTVCEYTHTEHTEGEVVYKSNYDGTCSGVCPICSQVLVGPQTHNWDWQTGKCSRCGTAYGGGSGSTTCEHTYVTKNDETNHWEECSKCNEIKENSTEAHTGATHANEGKCTVCDYQYEKHEPSSTLKEYKQTETGHTPVYTCSYSGCTETCDGTTEAHTGATHANGGVCTVCRYQYENHGQSTTVKEYIKTETGHTPIYACTNSECTETYNGTIEAHTGATHANGGVCTVCRYQYENHGQSTTVKEYTETATGHTPIYACTNSECTETYNGTTEAHTGATHANGGKCTVCGYAYEIHIDTKIPKEYIKTETEHTPMNVCSHTDCTETFRGTTEAHKGATHANGGVCTVCRYQYENHGQSTTVKEYIKTETGHTPVYTCAYSGCTETYNGTTENHILGQYTDNKNGTHSATCSICSYKLTAEHNYQNQICSECGAKESTGNATCEHSYVVKSNKTNHWEECSKCGQIKTGTLKVHTYGSYTDNKDGTHSATCSICSYKLTAKHNYQNQICSECGAKESTGNATCEHSYVVKSNKTNHWEECSKCGEVRTGTLKVHTYGTYTDNKNGTHSATCSICSYKLTAEHNYQNQICSECGAKESTGNETCEHSYVVKSNKENHWEECSKCGQIKTGTLEEHAFTNYVDNKDGTHTATCSKCGYKLTEEHQTDGNCPDCGNNSEQKPSVDNNNQNNNNNSNNNGDKTDNTVVDKDIPYTGVTSIAVLITIFVIGVVGIISAVKMKKYSNM